MTAMDTTVSAAPPAGRSLRAVVMAYVALTKPRIIELLLITTVPAMVVAGNGWPARFWWLVPATLVGGSLAAGSANTINCYVDRDIDDVMKRTSRRPLPGHLVSPRNALRFGIGLGVASVGWNLAFVNWQAAALGVLAILFYVFVYTLGMKRSTPSNIVIGGAAGCMPVVIGWAAVTGRVSVTSLVLFGIVFYWTPPHFWALALKFKDDYAAAGVPMLPVVAGVRETARQILLYSALMVAISLILWPVAPMGPIYLVSAVVLGVVFMSEAWKLWQRVEADQDPKPMRLFHWSITYLTLLFAAMALDKLVT